MGLNSIIKNILKENAGISFEVRNWAKLIEKHVNDYLKHEEEKLKNSEPKQKPLTKSPYGSWSYNDQEVEEGDELPPHNYTHFLGDDGKITQKAQIYADELFVNADVIEDFVGIENVLSSKLLSVEFDSYGTLFINSEGSKIPQKYMDGVEEIVLDHMVMGKPFHTPNYDLIYASEDTGFDYAMFENDNRWNSYYTPKPIVDKIEINGKDFPNAYKDFKVDKWVIINSGRIEYDHWKSGYNDNGEYVVYLNMPMHSIGGSALVHEIKHAYDDWNRISKGAPPIRDGWEIKNIYTPDFEKLVLGGSYKLNPMLHPIIRYYYLGSKLESPAYLENEYDNSSLGGDYRGTAKKMMDFKASNFLNKKGEPAKGLQESWTKLITEYNIPFFRKFKNVVDFLNYTEKHFNKRGRNIMKRIDKMRYIHNKPAPKYEPRVYTRPTEEPKKEMPKPNTNPNQLNLFNSTSNMDELNLEVDKLEKKWDDIYDEFIETKNPKLREKLNDLDEVIQKKIDKINRL